MALYAAEGLILGARNWGEADKMMTIFTRERGLLRAAAFGCRRPRSALSGAMQMFVHADLQLAEGERLDTVKTAAVRRHHQSLSEHLPAMAYATFVAEIACTFQPEGVPDEHLFERLTQILTAFETRNPRVTALAAVLQILAAAGLQQTYAHCLHCGQEIIGDAYFHRREGGALCMCCREDGCDSFPAELRTLLLGLQDLAWEAPLVPRMRGSVLMAAETLVLAHVQELAGHPLRSLNFLTQIG